MTKFRSFWRSSILACAVIIASFIGGSTPALARAVDHPVYAAVHALADASMAVYAAQPALAPVDKHAKAFGANMVSTSSHDPSAALPVALLMHSQTPGASAMSIHSGAGSGVRSERL